jgi:hypothetical protein
LVTLLKSDEPSDANALDEGPIDPESQSRAVGAAIVDATAEAPSSDVDSDDEDNKIEEV